MIDIILTLLALFALVVVIWFAAGALKTAYGLRASILWAIPGLCALILYPLTAPILMLLGKHHFSLVRYFDDKGHAAELAWLSRR